MNNPYLQEAITIGEQLLTIAEYNEHGISWKTLSPDADEIWTWKKSEDIYSGVCGIVLFFLALYKVTANKKYLRTAHHGMQWVDWYCKTHPIDFSAFITGNMGVAYTYLKLYEITNDKADLKKAMLITKSCYTSSKENGQLNDYLMGIAGTVLALLHLHAVTKEKWIAEYINKCTTMLIHNAKYDKNGLYWDFAPEHIHPLSDFSHGSSGIGFVFFELGEYFQNPAFHFIAEQAFTYEDSYYDTTIKNWPFFSLPVTIEKKYATFEKAYQKNNLSIFTKALNLNQWCHGAAGIGLARLRTITKSALQQKQIDRALRKTRNTHLRSFTLCHGNGGNADLFLEYYLYTHNEKYLRYAKTVADNAIKQKKKFGKYIPGIKKGTESKTEDPSLFRGIAGIGYFFLRVIDPEKVPSILAPTIKNNKRDTTITAPFNLHQVKQQLIENIFPRTMQLVSHLSPHLVKEYFSKKSKTSSQLYSFMQFIENVRETVPPEKKQELREIYQFELYKVQKRNNANNGLLYVTARVQQKESERLLQLPIDKLIATPLQLVKEVKLFRIDQKNIVTRLTAYGVKELAVNDFCMGALELFKEKSSIKTIIKKSIDAYDAPKENKQKVKEQLIEQVREAITYGLLSTNSLEK